MLTTLKLPELLPETHVAMDLGAVLNIQFPDDPERLWHPTAFNKDVLRRNGYAHFTADAELREDAFKAVWPGRTVIKYERQPQSGARSDVTDTRLLHVTVKHSSGISD